MKVPVKQTAHERLKSSFRRVVWTGLAISATLHIAILGSARFEVSVRHPTSPYQAMSLLAIPSGEFEIPSRANPIDRPALPRIETELTIPEIEIAIPRIEFEEPLEFELPPPPVAMRPIDLSAEPAFTPYDIRPRLQNQPELERELARLYPERLQDAGIGGITILWIFLNEAGAVKNTRIVEGSGYDDLDQVALTAVRETARFTPAFNRNVKVPVWVQMPVHFVTVEL